MGNICPWQCGLGLDYIFNIFSLDYIFNIFSLDYIFNKFSPDYIFNKFSLDYIFNKFSLDYIFNIFSLDYIFNEFSLDFTHTIVNAFFSGKETRRFTVHDVVRVLSPLLLIIVTVKTIHIICIEEGLN